MITVPAAFPTTLSGLSKSAQKRAIRDAAEAQARLTSVDAQQRTLFRAAEKTYMIRGPCVRPDIGKALDLGLLDPDIRQVCSSGGWMGSSDAVPFRELKGAGERRFKAYALPDVPGLVVLPGFLSHSEQQALVRWALADHARPPNETNLDTHYLLPPSGIWSASIDSEGSSQLIQPRAAPTCQAPPLQPSRRTLIANEPASPTSFATLAATPKPPAAPSTSIVAVPTGDLVPKLRWANIGRFYHWGTKQYDFSRPKVPVHDHVASICKKAVRTINWSAVFDGSEGSWPEGDAGWGAWTDGYEPDAGIVNYYQQKDTLMGHVDRSEVCATAPLVSISLGLSAIFLIGGTDRNTKPYALVLRSGDVMIMAGPRCRRAYHGVPRILEGSLPAHLASREGDWEPYAKYLNSARINVNVRQVFPKDFDPSVYARP